MLKKIFFYLSTAGILIIVIALTLVLGGIFSKKPVKPQVTAPVAEAPSIAEEKIPLPEIESPLPEIAEEEVPPAPKEVPPAIEEKAPAPLPTEAAPLPEKKALKYEFQKGMVYVAWTPDGYSNAKSPQAMEQLIPLGVNWVAVVPTWFQEQYNSITIYPQADKTPTDQSLLFAIRKLHELKFKVMLKPHIDLVRGEGKWRGDIGCTLIKDWQAWFDSYANFILHYAKLAQEENVELLCIGTELVNSTYCKPDLWRELIRKIREVYQGPLTYAANWDKEFNQIAFWDALDYAGIDPYFPLITSANPTVEQLKDVWKDWLKEIEEWQAKINKPVIIAEISYNSSRGAADEPWKHVPGGELDMELQVNLYKALLETFWDKPWFYGVYWWYWGTNPRMGGVLNRGFTPQNKPAQEVLKEWYTHKPVLEKTY